MSETPPFRYSLYGLTVASELPLPELTSGHGETDIVITLTPGDPDPPDPAGAFAFRGGGQDVRLEYPQVAALTMRNGREITVEPRRGVDPSAVRDVLLGPALGVLLHQRGVLALHASSVLLPRGVAAFAGASGWGKSTMAGALARRGHDLVADDITAVEPSATAVEVLPAFPRLRLWPEAAAAIGLDPAVLPPALPGMTKRAQPLASRLTGRRLPFIALYILTEGVEVALEPLSARDALLELVRHSFCVNRLVELGARGHFLQCAEVARRVPVRRLLRPRDLGMLGAVADLVESESLGAP